MRLTQGRPVTQSASAIHPGESRLWPPGLTQRSMWVVPSERLTLAASSELEEVEQGELARMDLSVVPVSRRGMIALVSLFGVSGCVESFDDKVARDPYISLIKQDPMFAWAPPGNLSRKVSYTPRRGQPLASQSSVMSVVFTVPDPATIPALVKLAKDTSLSNGYTDKGKRTTGDVTILLDIQADSGGQSFSLVFTAPVD